MDTILLTGKTGLFSKEVLQYTGEVAQIFLTGCKSGNEMKGLSDRVRQFPVSPEDHALSFRVFHISAGDCPAAPLSLLFRPV